MLTKTRSLLLLALLALAVLLPGGRSAYAAGAQQDATPTAAATEPDVQPAPDWSAPANLSRSGATTAPRIAVDGGGRLHALWLDALAGFVYVQGDGVTWSSPVGIETPFGTRRLLTEAEASSPTPYFVPELIADAVGDLHAFWIDDRGPGEPVLYHSQVPATQARNFDSWSPANPLATGAVRVAAAAYGDAVHVAYVRAFESTGPAGIFTRRLGSAQGWSAPVALYPSPYLRALTADEADISIAADGDQVAAAWSDPRREQVFLATSADGGRSWATAQEVDRRAPTDNREAIGPRRIAAGIRAGNIVLTWNAGHEPGQSCSQYSRASNDGDATWSTAAPIGQGLPGCLTRAQFTTVDGALHLLGTIESDAGNGQIGQTTYLLAWDGNRWSEAQSVPLLSSFTNEATNQIVEPRCLRVAGLGDTIGVIACDQGLGGDIWWTQRPVGDPAAWFPPPSAWSSPVMITEQEGLLEGLSLVADGLGRVHAFWYQPDGTAVLHAIWDGTSWSSPTPVVNAVRGTIEDSAVAGGADRLMMIWRDAAGHHFAQAAADAPDEWSQPSDLSGIPAAAADATLLGARGQIVIAYALPLNEGRGIYIITSADNGATWSDPVLVFDAAASGWDMVGSPSLAESDGAWHVQYARRSLPPDMAPLEIGYSRSEDGGQTWTALQSGGPSRAVWNRVLAGPGPVVYQFWVDDVGERYVIRHALSPDQGRSWTEAAQVSSLPPGSLPAATMDSAGRPHILGIDGGRIVGWTWDGQGWTSSDALPAGSAAGPALEAVADSTGRLVAVYSEPGASADGVAQTTLHSASRPLDIPQAALPTPLPPPATAVPLSTVTPSPTPQPTATVAISITQPDDPLATVPGAGSETGRLALALVPTAFVVLVVVLVGVRAMRKGGR